MTDISRRSFLKAGALIAGAAAAGLPPHPAAAAEKAKVYFTRKLDAESLIGIYRKVGSSIGGRIAVKVHTGEPNGPNIIPREWVRDFLGAISGCTVVECNVLYGSPRQTAEGHRKVLETNGWSAFTTVDIMDAEGDAMLPVKGGKWIKELSVGRNLLNYDAMIALTHFKGHVMGGFGGSLKNIAIGCASGKVGKDQLHREGSEQWAGGPRFMERMVEGGKAVVDFFGGRMAHVNVLRRMSVSCDCEGTSAQPVTLPDIGILASTDILAVDKASVDMIYALPADVRAPMVERIESRSGLRQLTYMKELGMGTDEYELIEI